MRKLLYGLVAASALAVASAANAELTIIPPTTVSNPPPSPILSNDGEVHFSFGYSDSTAIQPGPSPFEELLSFHNTNTGFYSFGVQTTADLVNGIIDPATDVDFTNVWVTTLCNAAATAVPGTCGPATTLTTLQNNSDGDVHEDWSRSGVFLGAGDYTIHIAGTRGTASSFSGTLSFARGTQLPEPGTWALMLLGFGAAGWQLRRRRQPLLTQAA
jgi:hypothetical protein